MSEPLTDLGPAWLFCPADRPERFQKAADRADVVILDLEDGVVPEDRQRARAALAAASLDPTRTVVRINPAGTLDHDLDLEALSHTTFRLVMLAKTESVAQVSNVQGFDVVALCETPAGVLNAEAIAESDTVTALMWGAEDLIAGLGGQSSRDANGRYRDVARHARNVVLLAARSAGKTAIDSVYLDISDLAGLTAESADAVASGFGVKACIHPTQVDAVRRAFTPAPAAVDWATRVVEAAQQAGVGVFSFEGRMVDEPVLRQARSILTRSSK